ncbi:MAG: amino acid ABC transporter ATP-binding protein [Thermodesulfobacteriota bacterium]
MISIKGLSFRYQDGTEALNDVDMKFDEGRITAVLGESGSGKTTLLRCVGRFLTPDRGSITLDGRDISALQEREFRKSVGIVFQNLSLFPHLTVLENMTLALKKVQGMESEEAGRKATFVLDRLGIRDLADSYPSQVSGGQAQRAAIARGLVLEPSYMLLDEPTSALDAATTEGFAAWLSELRNHTNFIIVTHDTLFAEMVADSGYHLSGGCVLAEGTIGEIVEQVRGGIV